MVLASGSSEPSTTLLPPAASTPGGAPPAAAMLAASVDRWSITLMVAAAAAPWRPSSPISFSALRRVTACFGTQRSPFAGFVGGSGRDIASAWKLDRGS